MNLRVKSKKLSLLQIKDFSRALKISQLLRRFKKFKLSPMSNYVSTLNISCSLHLEFLNALLNRDFFNTLFRSKPEKSGFTLIEVLVSLVITGMVVAVFFQILSAGVRLEYSSASSTADIVNLKRAFGSVIAQDVRTDDFQWQGENDGDSWSLRIEQIETLKTHADSELPLNLDSELYRYVFEYINKDGRKWTLVRYIQYDPGFFSEDFKSIHFR